MLPKESFQAVVQEGGMQAEYRGFPALKRQSQGLQRQSNRDERAAGKENSRKLQKLPSSIQLCVVQCMCVRKESPEGVKGNNT